MPTYGFECPGCHEQFDIVRSMTDDSPQPCPSCGTVARKLFFPAGIVFKGSGFYKTDSRSSGSGSASSPSSTSSNPSTTGSSEPS